MSKIIKGHYRVADCEHYGDISSSESYLRSLGCTIVSSHWDGRDCGEAYIEFTFSDNCFKEIYDKLSGSASFSADINDYLSFGKVGEYRKMTKKELYELKDKMATDYSAGYLERLPLLLFFEIKEWQQYSPEEIISKCLSFLSSAPVSVLGYNVHVVDGNTFCDVLMETSYQNLTSKQMEYGIGDYCLGNRGWLKSQRIYGECRCVHKFINTHVMWGYEYIQRVISRILAKGVLSYRGGSYYHPIDKDFGPESYLNSDGSFNSVIIGDDGIRYSLKDPRFWEWKEYVK